MLCRSVVRLKVARGEEHELEVRHGVGILSLHGLCAQASVKKKNLRAATARRSLSRSFLIELACSGPKSLEPTGTVVFTSAMTRMPTRVLTSMSSPRAFCGFSATSNGAMSKYLQRYRRGDLWRLKQRMRRH